MKKKIHPKYQETKVTCGCGESFTTRSTKKVITVEICSKCHPFYTGKQKFVDSAGQVEKFQKKFGWTEGKVKEVEKRKAPKKPPPVKPPKPTPSAKKQDEKPAAEAKPAKKEGAPEAKPAEKPEPGKAEAKG